MRRIFFLSTFFTILFTSAYFFSLPKQTPTPLPYIPTPTPISQKQNTTEVHASDGTMKAVLSFEQEKNGSTLYTLTTAHIDGTNKQTIFSQSEDAHTKIILPDNAWSPNNAYLFVLEKHNDVLTALVFKASGQAFATNQTYLDVTPLFLQRNTTLEVTNVTGWASSTLLYVTTQTDSSNKGPTFWFDLGSKSFLQLAS